MKLVEDEVARHYKVRALREKMPNFVSPSLICLPIAVLTSFYLYHYDVERRHTWLVALTAVPILFCVLNLLPYSYYLFTERWVLGKSELTLRGSIYHRVRITEQGLWKLEPIEDLPGYYWLSIRDKNIRSSIILAEERFPMIKIRNLIRTKYGEQGGGADAEPAV